MSTKRESIFNRSDSTAMYPSASTTENTCRTSTTSSISSWPSKAMRFRRKRFCAFSPPTVSNGVACIKRGDDWTKIVKQRPKEMDEWTHYMHDSTGNAVSNDTLVGPPANLQWVGSPRWTRHHEHMSSINALVSANGRLFYVMDEGSRASIQLPPKWHLIARDAFNGTILWKRSIPLW